MNQFYHYANTPRFRKATPIDSYQYISDKWASDGKTAILRADITAKQSDTMLRKTFKGYWSGKPQLVKDLKEYTRDHSKPNQFEKMLAPHMAKLTPAQVIAAWDFYTEKRYGYYPQTFHFTLVRDAGGAVHVFDAERLRKLIAAYQDTTAKMYISGEGAAIFVSRGKPRALLMPIRCDDEMREIVRAA